MQLSHLGWNCPQLGVVQFQPPEIISLTTATRGVGIRHKRIVSYLSEVMSSIASGNFSASRSLRVRSIPLMKGRTPVPAIPGKGTSLRITNDYYILRITGGVTNSILGHKNGTFSTLHKLNELKRVGEQNQSCHKYVKNSLRDQLFFCSSQTRPKYTIC